MKTILKFLLLATILILGKYSDAYCQITNYYENFNSTLSVPYKKSYHTDWTPNVLDSSRITAQSSVKRCSTYGFKLTVYPNDTVAMNQPYNGRSRAEIGIHPDNAEDSTYYYLWSFKIPTDGSFIDNPGTDNYCVIAQWLPDRGLTYPCTKPEPVFELLYQQLSGADSADNNKKRALVIRYGRENAGTGTGCLNETKYSFLDSINKGAWVDLMLQIRWSSTARGFIKVWCNGKCVKSIGGANMYVPTGATVGNPNYFKMGIYRGNNNNTTQSIHLDEFFISRSIPSNLPAGYGTICERPKALLVVDTPVESSDDCRLRKGDCVLESILISNGFDVTVMDDDNVTGGSVANGKALIYVSSTVNDTKISNKFRDVSVSVVINKHTLYDDMAMTAGTSGTDYGFVASTATIKIVNQGHMMAGGLGNGSKTVYIYRTPGFYWGYPNSNAIKIATKNGTGSDTNKVAIFGYESGASMIGGVTANSRRVGMFIHDSGMDTLSTEGIKLINAAIDWAMQRTPGSGLKIGDGAIIASDNKEDVLFTLAPNPAENTLTVLTQFNNEIAEVKIMDQSGRIIKTMNTSFGNGRIDINTEDLANGLYYLFVRTDKGTVVVKKFIVKR